MERSNIQQLFALADKIIGISAEDLACEKRWQQGAGLAEIIDNVHGHLNKSCHFSAMGRIVELEEMRRKLCHFSEKVS